MALEALEGSERDLAAVDRILRSSPDELATVPQGEVAALVSAMYRVFTVNPVEGSSSILLGTPALSGRGVEVRRRVALVQRALADVSEEHERMHAASENARKLLTAYAIGSADLGFEAVVRMVGRQGPAILSQLRRDEALLAAMTEKAYLQQRYVLELGVATGLLDELSEFLEGLL